ncbi:MULTISPECIES: heme NO-binding domain-containing protein [unclassified Ruegeria]|uniref:heme NO-binding domain-containing protein n=1 Tax=unclassified Ruegeria TaxID=2625375 RepID=UPI0014884C46|nr:MULTISPECIES: heme NO-binding domain-containing protein [unclassified Ruegeria]NOE34632.1 heme NO-binding protein [Ruegeria sp. HKCCD7318]
MHGLINRAIQSFVCATYGQPYWVRVAETAQLGFVEFEAMLVYDDDVTARVLDALSGELNRPRAEILEDVGTYLVSHPNMEGLRRLLRFGGVSYVEFLHSLDDLADRVRLAVSDLTLPALELRELSTTEYQLFCFPGLSGYSSVMVGVLRAMADDYGALVMLSHEGQQQDSEVISIMLVESAFAEGRHFDLGARTG